MILLIDTTTPERIWIALAVNGKKRAQSSRRVSFHESERLLGMIDHLLKRAHTPLRSMRGIVVRTGRGSFTAVRLAVTVANTLGWTLHIPVIALDRREGQDQQAFLKTATTAISGNAGFMPVQAQYERPPTISRPSHS